MKIFKTLLWFSTSILLFTNTSPMRFFKNNTYTSLKKTFNSNKKREQLTSSLLDKSIKQENEILSQNNIPKDVSYIKKEYITEPLKIIVIGDVHGQFEASDSIIEDLIRQKVLSKDLKINIGYQIIILGDFVDRGPKSLEICLTFMMLRMLNGNKVIILRGNHEDIAVFSRYGFSEELFNKMSRGNVESFQNKFDTYFKKLPTAYFIKTQKNKFLMFNHGGWEDIPATLNTFLSSTETFYEIKNEKLAKQLLWNDINIDTEKSEQIISGIRGDYDLKEYPWQLVLKEMNKLNIEAKFMGHMHPTAEECYLKYHGYTKNSTFPGFYRTTFYPYFENEYYKLPNNAIYVLISGPIQDIEYQPSYLIIDIDNSGNYKISGCSLAKKETKPIALPDRNENLSRDLILMRSKLKKFIVTEALNSGNKRIYINAIELLNELIKKGYKENLENIINGTKNGITSKDPDIVTSTKNLLKTINPEFKYDCDYDYDYNYTINDNDKKFTKIEHENKVIFNNLIFSDTTLSHGNIIKLSNVKIKQNIIIKNFNIPPCSYVIFKNVKIRGKKINGIFKSTQALRRRIFH